MFSIIMLILLSYLMGAIPVAYIYCRFRGKDITKEGSGNVGATNASRLFGKGAFFTILFFDALKGFIPVRFLAPWLCPQEMDLQVITILTLFAAIAGHIWSVFINFKGGKGVATSLGCLLAVMPVPCILSGVVFAIIFAITRIVSAGSICAAMSFPLFAWMIESPPLYTKFSIVLSLLIIFTHRSNIKRLLDGTEKGFTTKQTNN